MGWGTVEVEAEVTEWLASLDDQRWAQALMHLDLLEERGPLPSEPYTRRLNDKRRELRFSCGGERTRLTYAIVPGRRITMLTVFTKTRMREREEVERAQRALERCRREAHTLDEEEPQS